MHEMHTSVRSGWLSSKQSTAVTVLCFPYQQTVRIALALAPFGIFLLTAVSPLHPCPAPRGRSGQQVARDVSTSIHNPARYLRVPVGESFSPRHLIPVMKTRESFEQDRGVTFHLDLGHVPPPDCNTFLFQLLIEGSVRQEPFWNRAGTEVQSKFVYSRSRYPRHGVAGILPALMHVFNPYLVPDTTVIAAS